jgi:RNA polymerase sigma factor (sigma-70 family)
MLLRCSKCKLDLPENQFTPSQLRLPWGRCKKCIKQLNAYYQAIYRAQREKSKEPEVFVFTERKNEQAHDPRSKKYQYLLNECSTEAFDPGNEHDPYNSSLSIVVDPFLHKEERLELQEQLVQHLLTIAKRELTAHQWEVLKLYYLDGYTQQECGKLLGVNQSSCVKTLQGNSSYDYGDGEKRMYGGAFKKLRLILSEDPITQDFLLRLEELSEEK